MEIITPEAELPPLLGEEILATTGRIKWDLVQWRPRQRSSNDHRFFSVLTVRNDQGDRAMGNALGIGEKVHRVSQQDGKLYIGKLLASSDHDSLFETLHSKMSEHDQKLFLKPQANWNEANCDALEKIQLMREVARALRLLALEK